MYKYITGPIGLASVQKYDKSLSKEEFTALYLVYKVDGNDGIPSLSDLENGEITLVLGSVKLTEDDYMYDGDTIGAAILDAYSDLPEYDCEGLTGNDLLRSLITASNNIARSSRRGVGNVIHDDIFVYVGESKYNGLSGVDGGVIVSEAEIDGSIRYALIKHPFIEEYGFRLINYTG